MCCSIRSGCQTITDAVKVRERPVRQMPGAFSTRPIISQISGPSCSASNLVIAFRLQRQETPETSMDGLQGKVAIVTGGATKIGAAVARAFQREGPKGVIADINDKDGQAVANALGKDALFVRTDLADDSEIANCVERAVAAFGGID